MSYFFDIGNNKSYKCLFYHPQVVQFIISMDVKIPGKNTPPKGQNLKLQEKSKVFSDVTHVSQRSYQFQPITMVKHLNLDYFKVQPCNIPRNHNHKHCTNYHNAKDRKRFGNFYAAQPCPYIKQEQKCPEGDNCRFAHSVVQEHYSFQKYKKYFCYNYPHNVNECPYEDFCSYAHSEEQILTTLIHNYAQDDDFYMFYYKTVFCPFNLTKHDPSKCVYAHNWQDYRRQPNLYHYEAIPCINWKTKDYISISDYSSGCDTASDCQMCHGWKEQQYHPSFYKTIKCELQGCKKGSCPNYHSQKQKRVVANDIIARAFRYVPKNRIVEGVFKTSVNKQGFRLKPEHKTKTLVQPKMLAPQQNDFKVKTLVAVKEKRKSNEKEKTKWIKEKQIIDSGEESDDNDLIASQVQKLNLDG